MTTADTLMKLASEADTKADEMLSLSEAHAASLEAHIAGATGDATRAAVADLRDRAAFHRGQASGFRQSAYYAAILEGTHAYD